MRKKLLNKQEIAEVTSILMKTYPEAKAELDFTSPFELLIATILSAQCTDKRVNETTKVLFKKLSKPTDIYKIELSELESIIKKCGLYRNKAKNISSCCTDLVTIHDGIVPSDKKELVKLAGVGRKTANVVVSNAFGVPAIAVDTHVKRVSNRLGFIKNDNVDKIEERLMKIIEKEKWTKMHHVLIFHGRRICKARNPLCNECPVNHLCISAKN